MDETQRTEEITGLIEIWEWCSCKLHTKWQRKRKNRNAVLMALAYAISGPNFVSPFRLTRIYKQLPTPLLDRKRVRKIWEAQPVPLLELGLGSFTKESPLRTKLDEIRATEESNRNLDGLTKKMRAREKRFGLNWYGEGHHPEAEFRALEEGMASLLDKLKGLFLKEHRIVERLALEVLAQGPWRFGELRASTLVRKTPESLLNRTTRLKLWEAAQAILAREMDDHEMLGALGSELPRKLSSALKASLKAQGYTVDQVIDDMINFDMHKSRTEITS